MVLLVGSQGECIIAWLHDRMVAGWRPPVCGKVCRKGGLHLSVEKSNRVVCRIYVTIVYFISGYIFADKYKGKL